MVVVAFLVTACAAPSSDDARSPAADESPGVGAAHLSGPGTALRDGLVVAEGTALIGAVFEHVGRSESGDVASSWHAVLQVDGDPLDVWRSFLDQFPSELNPQLAPPGPVGCQPENPQVDSRPGCATYAIGGTLEERQPYYVDMVAPQGDVTGHYLLQVYEAGDYCCEMTRPLPDVDPNLVLPAAVVSRERPAIGDVLGPGVEDRYALLPGTEFIALYGPGSGTGGFDAILHLTPGDDLAAVVDAYAEQADQFPDSSTGIVRTSRTDGDTIYTTIAPPGGAGGYQGWIHVVDQPGPDHDYLYYTLAND